MCVRQKMPQCFWGLAVASSLLPEADVITFGTGIQYEDVLGHRAFRIRYCLPPCGAWWSWRSSSKRAVG